jgi:flagellar protein FliO/FliZ
MFETLFGAEVPPALKFFLAFVVVLALIGATAWLVRRFGAERFGGSAARGRQPRLAVVDAAAVDGRRRLVIIRRDNVEHLLMIGGPTDVVVEQNIVRAMGAPRDKIAETPAARGIPAGDTLTRPVPLGEGTLWPLQPQPEVSNRPQRPAVADEQMQWTWQSQPEPMPRPARPENLADLADNLSGRPTPPRESKPSIGRTVAPSSPNRPAATPSPTPIAKPAEPTHTAAEPDQNLAEIAQRLEAALRHPNEPPAAEAPAKAEPTPPRPTPPEVKPARAEAKPSQPKALYDTLEQEMASLLGRPPGKT